MRRAAREIEDTASAPSAANDAERPEERNIDGSTSWKKCDSPCPKPISPMT
jgi:hypothetical protein